MENHFNITDFEENKMISPFGERMEDEEVDIENNDSFGAQNRIDIQPEIIPNDEEINSIVPLQNMEDEEAIIVDIGNNDNIGGKNKIDFQPEINPIEEEMKNELEKKNKFPKDEFEQHFTEKQENIEIDDEKFQSEENFDDNDTNQKKLPLPKVIKKNESNKKANRELKDLLNVDLQFSANRPQRKKKEPSSFVQQPEAKKKQKTTPSTPTTTPSVKTSKQEQIKSEKKNLSSSTSSIMPSHSASSSSKSTKKLPLSSSSDSQKPPLPSTTSTNRPTRHKKEPTSFVKEFVTLPIGRDRSVKKNPPTKKIIKNQNPKNAITNTKQINQEVKKNFFFFQIFFFFEFFI